MLLKAVIGLNFNREFVYPLIFVSLGETFRREGRF